MSFPAKVIAGIAAILLASFAAIWLLRSGEEDLLVGIVERGAASVRTGDAEACIALLARDYSHGGQTREQAADEIRVYVKPGRWSGVDLLSIDPAVEGDSGRAVVRARLSQGGEGFPSMKMPVALRIHFRKRDGAWAISGYDRLER